MKNPDKKTFALKITVKGKAKKQGDLQYPIGVELKVLEDELGIFENSKQLFWAAGTSGRFMVTSVITYDASRSPSQGRWGRWSTKDGSAMNLAFFGSSPGTEISMSKGRDALLLKDIIKIPGEEKPVLEFVRKVKKGDKDGMLDKAFEERMLFASKKGLILLEQTIGGKPSMTWTLKKFAIE